MYDYLYNYAKKNYPELKVNYYDTDSLVLDIPTERNVYDDMVNHPEYHSYEGINKESPMYAPLVAYCSERKIDMGEHIKKSQALGLMKDENINTVISEFCAIRSKCYSYVKINDKNDKRLKGIKKCVVKNQITHEDFRLCLFEGVKKSTSQF